jgi:hypothetical protein
MKAYVAVSGLMFLLLVLAHAARIVAEGVAVAAQPLFAISSIFSLTMCVWSWRVFRRQQGS